MIKLFNTLHHKKEEFVPIKQGNVGIYSCGPTVYKYAHAGNMRAYIFVDTLVRMFLYNGYKVKWIMNVTDVGHLLSDSDTGEDKMNKSAREEHKSPLEIAKYYTDAFLTDMHRLNILTPTVMPHATDNIPQMLEIVKALLEKGYAYEIDDGIYYDVSKFADYGKLSGINLDEQKAGARVEINEQKRNHFDFALWKKAQPNHIMQWDSPWGKGFPGWHIECTAMSKRYLGEVFDIHTGGVDHIPVHHENEIAQSEAWLGKKTTNYWLHNEWMLYEGGKMSKSLGNGYTVGDLMEKHYSPLAFRYLCLNTHYRQKLNFSFESLDGAQTAYNRLIAVLAQHKNSPVGTSAEKINAYLTEFNNAVNDDLGLPSALSVLFTAIKEPKSKDIFDLAVTMDKVLGLDLANAKAEEEKTEITPELQKLLDERAAARTAKEWAKSDEIRKEIEKLGYAVKDTKDGQTVSKK